MKKVLAFLVSLFFLSCLTGCLLVPKDTEPVEQIGEGTLGSYYVKITDHFVAKTISGKDVFILSFDFTNNNSSGVSAASALGLTLFQSGIELTGVTTSRRLNVVAATKRNRAMNGNIPPHMYVIEDMAIDGLLILQDVTCAVYSAPPHGVPRKVFDCLADYIKASQA